MNERNPYLAEIARLRRQLDEANATIANLRHTAAEDVDPFLGVAGLTRTEAIIVSTVAKYGRCTWERVYRVLYGDKDEPRARQTVNVMMCRIRRHLKPYGVTIATLWGVGWEMSKESQDNLRHLAGLPVIESPSMQATQRQMVA